MILYHGSYIAINKPDLTFSRLRTDFGRGFYLTPIREQAHSWAARFKRERGTAVVSSYAFSECADDGFPQKTSILEFDSHNIEWLNFIMACRLGQPVDTQWELIIGGVANDKVFDTLQLYFDKLITAEEAIGRLRYSKPNLQYCFKTQELIEKTLKFVGSEEM